MLNTPEERLFEKCMRNRLTMGDFYSHTDWLDTFNSDPDSLEVYATAMEIWHISDYVIDRSRALRKLNNPYNGDGMKSVNGNTTAEMQ